MFLELRNGRQVQAHRLSFPSLLVMFNSPVPLSLCRRRRFRLAGHRIRRHGLLRQQERPGAEVLRLQNMRTLWRYAGW